MPDVCNCQNDLKQMDTEARRSILLQGLGRNLQADIARERANQILDRIEICGCPLSHEIATMRRM